MQPFLTGEYGNPSSIHSPGQRAKAALEQARFDCAQILECKPEELIFTSGGTESDNLALRGFLQPGQHLATSAIEHHAVLDTARDLEKSGIKVTFLQPDYLGIISAEKIIASLQPETRLASIMLANNEIGSLNPIREIAAVLAGANAGREEKIIFHSDAVQAPGQLPISVRELGVDSLSLSAHKFGGPRGAGLLFIREGLSPQAVQTGGGQEFGLRSGTENVAAIVGMTAALQLAESERVAEADRLAALRDWLVEKVLQNISESKLNGDPKNRLPGNIHFSFKNIKNESLLVRLDMAGFACSAGSACQGGVNEPSHVIAAIERDSAWRGGALRVSLGRETSREQLERFAAELAKIISDLRK